jgi:hypothetical protein
MTQSFATLCTTLLSNLCLASVLLVAGCAEVTPTGPSLSDVQLSGITTAPTAGDRSLCCCRVVGTATNRNSVPVHATLKFSAFQTPTAAEPLSTLIYFIKDFQPGATHAIDAPGFIFPCNVVNNLKTEVEVRGISFPPL